MDYMLLIMNTKASPVFLDRYKSYIYTENWGAGEVWGGGLLHPCKGEDELRLNYEHLVSSRFSFQHTIMFLWCEHSQQL